MFLHDLDERFVVKFTFRHPWRKLTVPDQVVATDLQTVFLCVVDVSVTVLEGEVSAVGLGRFPLLRILWSDPRNLRQPLLDSLEVERPTS